jgi:hypothetical protein
LVVMDPSCGNWVALAAADGTLASSPWEDILPPVATESRVSFDDVDGDGDSDIVASSVGDLVVVRNRIGTWEATRIDIGGGPFLPPTFIRTMYAVISPERLVFQTLGRLELLDVASPSSPVLITQEVKSASWVRPFDAFDHLVACPVVLGSGRFRPMLGIGVFGPDAGPVPREIQLLEFKEPGTMAVSDVGLGAESVAALAVVPGGETQDPLVGIIDGEQTSTRFILAAWKGCQGLTELSSGTIEFDWKTPPAPPTYSEHVLAKRGVVLTGIKTPDGATFFHYDGFALRTFSGKQTADGWSVSSMKFDLHSARVDVAW